MSASAYDFLESKIGKFNATHPFAEPEVDYEDVIVWLEEFAINQLEEIEKEWDTNPRKGNDTIMMVVQRIKKLKSK